MTDPQWVLVGHMIHQFKNWVFFIFFHFKNQIWSRRTEPEKSKSFTSATEFSLLPFQTILLTFQFNCYWPTVCSDWFSVENPSLNCNLLLIQSLTQSWLCIYLIILWSFVLFSVMANHCCSDWFVNMLKFFCNFFFGLFDGSLVFIFVYKIRKLWMKFYKSLIN